MLITVSPAAKILDTSEATVRVLSRRGELPCEVTESGTRWFDRETVERIAAERKARRAAAARRKGR
jgi:predicted site-specific integrase-resolvase